MSANRAGARATAGDVAGSRRDDADGAADADVERLWSALAEVMDPELPISLVDLGLIYDIRRRGGDSHVDVEMTFTAMGCPCMAFIRTDVRERLLAEPDVDSVEIHEVWDPPWSRERMTEKGKRQMREAGVAA